MHENSKLLFEKYALKHIPASSKVLEIGPDGNPSTYQRMSPITCYWHTLDINSDVRPTWVSADEYSFRIPDGSYDVVLSGQVIEHVRKIWRWMPEVARVCRRGGIIITINPVSWEYHRAPYDCWRIYPEGMCALYDDAGIDVLLSEFESLNNDGVIDTITIGRKR